MIICFLCGKELYYSKHTKMTYHFNRVSDVIGSAWALGDIGCVIVK